MIKHEEILENDLHGAIAVIYNEIGKETTLEKVTRLLDSINNLLQFCLKELLRDGRIKVKWYDIPKVWKAAKKFIEDILDIYPQNDLLRKLEAMPLSIGDTLVNYVIWCFNHIVTPENKIKIGVMNIIPFIVRTIKMIKEITNTFKAKGLYNAL